jgi:hypothetical protein
VATKKRKTKAVIKGSFGPKRKKHAKRSRAHADDEVITGSWDDKIMTMTRKKKKKKSRRRNPEGMDGMDGVDGSSGGKEVSMLPLLVVGGLAALAIYLVMRKPQPKIESALRR